MDDVLLNKSVIIKRCLARVAEVYAGDEVSFRTDLTRQDSVILNMQRACEAAIDMSNRLLRLRQLGIPQRSRDSFVLLERAGLLDAQIAENMQKMVGFCNVAVHDYQALNLDIVVAVVTTKLDDFKVFSAAVLKLEEA